MESEISRRKIQLRPDISEADSGAVTLIRRFGSAANLNIHLHCLVLDGVYRRGADGAPVFVEVPAPTDEALQAVLHKIITRTMKLLARQGVLVEEEGSTYMAYMAYMAYKDGDSDEARTLRPLQAAACTYRIAFGSRAGQKVLTLQGVMPRETDFKRTLCAAIDGFSLHAAVRCGAQDRQALEQLCRYITRPALANEGVQTNAAGQVVLKLKAPWRDGTTHQGTPPLEFMQRLAARAIQERPLVAGATPAAASDPLSRPAGTLIYNFGQASRAGGAARGAARGAATGAACARACRPGSKARRV